MINRRRRRSGVNPRNRLGRCEVGQALTETMLVMGFLMLMVFGFVHLCMLATTKQLANLAAFGAARTAMVSGWDAVDIKLSVFDFFTIQKNFPIPTGWRAQLGWFSAAQVLGTTQRWWPDPLRNLPGLLTLETRSFGARERQGILVPYRVPFGYPILDPGAAGVLVEGFSPVVFQGYILELSNTP